MHMDEKRRFVKVMQPNLQAGHNHELQSIIPTLSGVWGVVGIAQESAGPCSYGWLANGVHHKCHPLVLQASGGAHYVEVWVQEAMV